MELSENVTHIKVGPKDVYLVGTAHVSKASVEDVVNTVNNVDPDTICVELCESRYNSIKNRDSWKKMDIFKVVKEKKALYLFIQLIMSSFYKKLGNKLNVKPGEEMIKGIELAEERNKKLVLADRNIETTLKRVWGYLGFFNKIKMIYNLIASIFVSEEIDSDSIEQLKNRDQMDVMMEEFSKEFPAVKKRLIDERDIYLAEKIRTAEGNKIVAVVGAGHVPGIKEHIHKENSIEEIIKLPPKSIVPQLIGWLIPISIVALIFYGFFKDGADNSIQSIYIWILANGFFSALGATIAFAHPLTIVSSFIAAPITSLNPMIAAGWVSGLVQAVVKKPTVEDMENLPDSIITIKGAWSNPVSRILLVVILANLGSFIGTFTAAALIARHIF